MERFKQKRSLGAEVTFSSRSLNGRESPLSILKVFLITGTQKFPFDRLLRMTDALAEPGGILAGADITAQSGTAGQQWKHIRCAPFLKADEMSRRIKEADLIITHGGTGSIIESLMAGRKVIAVPRLSAYGEHVDDHQKEIIAEFVSEGRVLAAENINDLRIAVQNSRDFTPKKWTGSREAMLKAVAEAIEGGGNS